MELIEIYKPEYSDYSWEFYNLGRISYGEALTIQQDLRQQVIDGADHKILLLEHDPVITLGRRTDPDHLLKSREELEEEGIELYRVKRGGSATYHGPGQLVGYVLCRSSRVGGIHPLVSKVLRATATTIRSFGIDCEIDEENPGIWTCSEIPRKLAAVGMSNTQGFTMHGFAINIDLPLTGFAAIVPCGLTLPVTTISIETGKNIRVEQVKVEIIEHLKEELSFYEYNTE